MKNIDSSEFVSHYSENKNFSEYKRFTAEEYYSNEIAKGPNEEYLVKEAYDGSSLHNSTSYNNQELDNKLDKKIDDNSSNIQSGGGSEMGSTSSASVSSASSASSTAASTSTAAVASSGGIVTAAAVIVTVVATGGSVPDINRFIRNVAGMDYNQISVDVNGIINNDNSISSLKIDNFYIDFPELNQKIYCKAGVNNYLITNLEPEKTYQYTISYKNVSMGNVTNYYSSSITTSGDSLPCGVFDELNNALTYDEEYQKANYSYSIYLSDYRNEYTNYSFYICSREQTNFSNMKSVIYESNVLDDNNYFKGMVKDLSYSELYLYVTGDKGEETDCLFEKKLLTQIDESISTQKESLIIDEESEVYSHSLDRLSINGELTYIDEEKSYHAYFTEYDMNDNVIADNVNADFIVNVSDNSFYLEGDAYYGLKKYRYVIYTLDGAVAEYSLQREIVYESQIKTYDIDQSYQATYDKIKLSDATLTYFDNYVRIDADPHFETPYADIFSYKVQLKNSEGNIIDEYMGRDSFSFNINDFYVDEFELVYYDIGYFVNQNVEYASYNSEGVRINIPSISLYEDIGFNGSYFTINYDCDMIYDYMNASIEITVEEFSFDSIDGNIKHSKIVNSISNHGEIVLDMLEGEYSNVAISAKLIFKDFQSDEIEHEVISGVLNTSLVYEVEITAIDADTYSYGDFMKIDFHLDFILPNNFSINISDDANSINKNFLLNELIEINELDPSTIYSFSVVIYDNYSNVYLNLGTYSIDMQSAKSYFSNNVTYTFTSVNPYDVVVTYNEDDTINVYRNVNFSCADENVSYNSILTSLTDSSVIEYRSRDPYAYNENILRDNYTLEYKLYYLYQNVTYTVMDDIPSGTIYFGEGILSAVVKTFDNTTTIIINNNQACEVDNRILVNNVEYTYTTYDSKFSTQFELVINEVIDVISLKAYINLYSYNYEAYKEIMPLKGNLYYLFEISSIEMS